ncbi:MAG: CpsB/CapC family capsule biosynthesis tyrosine phosphatase [Acidobacteriota bacterium]
MIDIHSHIVPGVDDGAADLAEAVRMCRAAAADGCRAIVATPHQRHPQFWNGERALLEHRFEVLCRSVGDGVALSLGAEIHADRDCLEAIDRLPGGDLLPLAGSRYLLLELPFHEAGLDPVELVYETRVAGWWPILAHPERIDWLANDPALLDELVAHGALLQLTAMSITGELGAQLAAVSARMLDDGLVFCIASDMHDARLRRPGLAAARAVVARSWGEAAATHLVETHPAAVLADREPPQHQPAPDAIREPAGGPSGLRRMLSRLGRGREGANRR